MLAASSSVVVYRHPGDHDFPYSIWFRGTGDWPNVGPLIGMAITKRGALRIARRAERRGRPGRPIEVPQ